MAAPAVLGYGEPARTNDHIVGPIAASFAIIAINEVSRPLRRINLIAGLWLLIAPWVLGYQLIDTINSTAVGVNLIVFSSLGGRIRHHYAAGWASLWRSEKDALQ
jgi:hypothetical protein